MGSSYNLLVVSAAAIGSINYGYAISILASTLGNPAFYVYMNLPPATLNSWISGWNCVLYAGALIGCIIYPPLSSRYGRRVPLAVGAALVAIGGALQAGEVHAAMLIMARIIIGAGIGCLLISTPLYQAEVAPPTTRGLMVGLHACGVGAGLTLAQFIGVAFFHVKGQAGWRAPLAIQCVPAVLLASIAMFLPESPRWLYLQGDAEAAENVLICLHENNADPLHTKTRQEFALMKAQIDLEAEEASQGVRAILHQPHLRKRFIVGWLIISCTQASGAIVILAYSPVIYATLGFSPFLSNIVTGVWGVVLTLGNFAGGIAADRVKRRIQIMAGLILTCFSLCMVALLSALYVGTTNKAGLSGATFFVFFFALSYGMGIEAPAFIYTSEIFPAAWRPAGVAFSISAVPIWSVIFTSSAAPAFANIGWKYFMLFATCTFVMIWVVLFYFPETKGYTLEQSSEAFGDRIVHIETLEKSVNETQHVEQV